MSSRFLFALALLPILLPLSLDAAQHAAPPTSSSDASAVAMALARQDEQTLVLARPGERDLGDVTRRLKMHRVAPINRFVRSAPPHYSVGHTEGFWIARASTGYFRLKATLLLETPHAHWYVEQNSGIPRDRLMNELQASARDFEARVYPLDHASFGQEMPLGPDHDPRITVLSAVNLPGAGGYFSAEDLYPRAVDPYSNQRKIIYVNIGSDGYALGSPDFASTAAHEFQHMIHWYQHRRDDTWTNEGSSVLAEVLTHHSPDGMDQDFAANPGTQVDAFCEPGSTDCEDQNHAAYYGAAFQWMFYFYQHYGGARALRALLSLKSLSGMASFDGALARLGSHDRSRDVFRNWVIANLVDDPGLAGGAYGYTPTYPGCCIHAQVTASARSYPFVRHALVNQFATDYVELKPLGPGTLHIGFNGNPTVRLVPNQSPQTHRVWWSNRGDEMDSTLTRVLDLRGVRHATLQYDIWYYVEQDYDYGYVEVSTDNGATWRILRGRYTTASNPNGENYGNGYTGRSTRVAGNRNGWLHDNVDLSPYTGRRVLIRFEHVTDGADNRPGLTIDNLRVPEIGFVDGPAATGWQSQGWVRVANLLPTRWLVQIVLYTRTGVQVRQVPLSAFASGGATIAGVGASVQRIVVAISPTAPQTTVPSAYTLTVR